MCVKEGEDLRLIYFAIARVTEQHTSVARDLTHEMRPMRSDMPLHRLKQYNTRRWCEYIGVVGKTLQHRPPSLLYSFPVYIIYKFFFARVPLTVTVPLENKNLHSAGLHSRINYTVRNVYKYIYIHTIIICETPFIHRGNETEGVRRESGSIINFDNEFKEKSRKKKTV